MVNYVFWCKIDFKHQKTSQSDNFTEKNPSISVKLNIFPKKLKQILKNSSKSQKTQGFGKKTLNLPEENAYPILQKSVKKKPVVYTVAAVERYFTQFIVDFYVVMMTSKER